jgi:osmotically inducible lipoprotein OsmB
MRRKIALGMALSSMMLMLTACGYSPGTRAVTGGLLGAGAGAGVLRQWPVASRRQAR